MTKHPYLQECGLTPDTIATFGLGYCNKGLMKGRIAIPLHNAAGDLVAYAGRALTAADEADGKYKLPPGFRKEVEVYNLHRITLGLTLSLWWKVFSASCGCTSAAFPTRWRSWA